MPSYLECITLSSATHFRCIRICFNLVVFISNTQKTIRQRKIAVKQPFPSFFALNVFYKIIACEKSNIYYSSSCFCVSHRQLLFYSQHLFVPKRPHLVKYSIHIIKMLFLFHCTLHFIQPDNVLFT